MTLKSSLYVAFQLLINKDTKSATLKEVLFYRKDYVNFLIFKYSLNHKSFTIKMKLSQIINRLNNIKIESKRYNLESYLSILALSKLSKLENEFLTSIDKNTLCTACTSINNSATFSFYKEELFAYLSDAIDFIEDVPIRYHMDIKVIKPEVLASYS